MTGFLKKLGVVAAAALVALSLSTVAFAATITIKDRVPGTDGPHIITQEQQAYEAYQIMTGKRVTVAGKDSLENPQWGTGIDVVNFLTALKADPTIGADFAQVTAENSAASAQAFADQAGAYADNSPEAQKLADIISAHLLTTPTPIRSSYDAGTQLHTITVPDLADGRDAWYFIQDNPAATPAAAPTAFMLRLTGGNTTTNIEPKADTPPFNKEVIDYNDSTPQTNHDNVWRKTADHDIDDTPIPYRLSFTLPNNYDNFDLYKVVFHDVMSKGLTLDQNSIKVYKYATNDGTVALPTNQTDLAADPNATLIPEANYTKVFGTYAGTDAKYTDGTTMDITFTDTKKVFDAAGNKIEFAKRDIIVVLYECTLNENANIGGGEDSQTGNPNEAWAGYSRNPNNDSEGTTPHVTNIVFTYQYNVNKVDKDKNPLEGAVFTLYKLDDSKATAPGAITHNGHTYYPIQVTTVGANPTTFSFKGIDDGTYRLVETTAPTGFDPIDPFDFKVVADHDNNTLELTSLTGEAITGTIDLTPELKPGTITSNVINAMPWLPQTGGIGTVLFYLVGGVLIVGAGVLLFVKRRTNKER